MAAGELTRAGRPITLQQKPFELLVQLVPSGQILSKQESMSLVDDEAAGVCCVVHHGGEVDG